MKQGRESSGKKRERKVVVDVFVKKWKMKERDLAVRKRKGEVKYCV